jgi:hypothetical protein
VGKVGDVEAHEFETPLGDVARGLAAVDDVPKATRGHHHDRVAVVVVPELAFGDGHSIQEFLDLQVLGLRVGEDFTDEVH